MTRGLIAYTILGALVVGCSAKERAEQLVCMPERIEIDGRLVIATSDGRPSFGLPDCIEVHPPDLVVVRVPTGADTTESLVGRIKGKEIVDERGGRALFHDVASIPAIGTSNFSFDPIRFSPDLQGDSGRIVVRCRADTAGCGISMPYP